MDRTARSLSTYVVLVKWRLDRELKDPAAGFEHGENRPLFDKARDIMRRESERRQVEEEAWIKGELKI